METKTKTSVLPKVGEVPTAKEATKNLKVMKTETIEEAQVIQEQKLPKPSYDQTIKIINDLHQKSLYCNRIGFYIDKLSDFEIKQKEEDLAEKNHYSGCNLTITDDFGNDFELKNPVLISDVVGYLGKRLQDKRSELEAEIILP